MPRCWRAWEQNGSECAGEPTGCKEELLSESRKLRVAVIGVGAFGRNHARVYHELAKEGAAELVALVDSDQQRARSVASQLGCECAVFASLEDLLAAGLALHAASVAVPTVHHLATARALMQAGVDVLIEKPLAVSLEEADELIALAARHQRVAMVGHLERFNPAVQAVIPMLTQPLFFEVHRLSIFTPRSLDVDVVLDLMIHDLDIVLSFVPSPLQEIRAVGLPILSPNVDIANVRMEFENGCVANFTASRVSTERVRKLRFFQPHQYVSIDYAKQDAFALTVDAEAMAALTRGAALEASNLGVAGTTAAMGGMPFGMLPAMGSAIQMSRPPVQAQEPLRAELLEFLRAVRERGRPLVPLEDGRRALAAALQIAAAIRAHARRLGLLGEGA